MGCLAKVLFGGLGSQPFAAILLGFNFFDQQAVEDTVDVGYVERLLKSNVVN